MASPMALELCQHPALLSILGVACGFVIHHGVFIHGEWHTQAPKIIIGHIWIFACLAFACVYTRGTELGALFNALAAISFGYLPGLTLSIIIYRVFFHRLAKAGFPGPWYGALSKIWNVWAARRGKNHLVLEAFRHAYGDFVRTGPAEITVFHPGAFMAIDGPRSECIKAEFYDILHPRSSLVTTRDKAVHSARRREWSGGFTTKALAVHEKKIWPHIEQLERLIEADIHAARPSNLRDYLYWFGFDAMGEFVFSKSFGMLQDQETHGIIARLQSALSLLGPLGPAPWLVHVGLNLLPRVGPIRAWYETLEWCRSQMCRRLEDSKLRPLAPGSDLAYYLMEEERSNSKTGPGAKSWKLDWLTGDSLLAIVAGSDPSTVTMIGVFAELAKHPEHAEKIYEEVADVDTNQVQALTKLAHLNGVINEALRLYPALLSGGARKTTKNGVTIGGKYIPPDTMIVCPRYSIGRREDCYERPLEFIPERWTTRPAMVRNSAAFTPFGTGSHSCLGRSLAEDMMRCVIARIVKKYRFRLAPGETGMRVLDEVKDQFVPNPGPLSLCFELRAEA